MADFLVVQSVVKIDMLKWFWYIFAATFLFASNPVEFLLITQVGWLEICQHTCGEYVLSAAPGQTNATEAA